MKKILLLLCLFLGMQTYAQDEMRELTTVIKVTPSSSERFDVAQLQLELNGQGMPENGFVWDATSSSFKGKLSYNPYEDNFIRLYMPDQSISYEGPIVFDFGNPEITTVEVNADFSPYHYVSFTSGSPEDYTVTLDYLGLSDGSVSGQSMPGVVTQRMDDGEFLRAEEYSYELSAFTPEGISVAVKNGKVTVEDEDVAVVTPEKLDDMTLVTFQVKDAEGKPAEAEVILLQANLDLSTDEQGSVQGYLQPGTYYYYPEMEGNYLASPATDFATFTASGNTTTVDYSFQDKGYKPVTFRMEGDVQSGSLTISPVGMEYDEFYVNNIDFPYTVYMVDGLYKYGVQPAYNPPMYFEAEHGLVNTAESRDVVLLHRPTLPCVHEWRKIVFQFGIARQYRKDIFVSAVEQLYGMGKGAILSVFVNAQIPDDSCKEDNRTFYEEVALLLNPSFIEIKHYCVCTFVSIGNVTHEIRVNRIAAVASARIIKIDDIELGLYLIAILMVHHVIVGNR